MRTIIVYTSLAHGNTEKVAKAMAEALGADLSRTADTAPETLKDYDLVGLGSGIYNGRHHDNIFNLVDRIPEPAGQKAFIFSTSGDGVYTLNNKLKSTLMKRGFTVVGSFACKGLDTYGIDKLKRGMAKGRPNDDDLREARAFVKNLAI
jgi:flavodoxin